MPSLCLNRNIDFHYPSQRIKAFNVNENYLITFLELKVAALFFSMSFATRAVSNRGMFLLRITEKK